MTSVTRRRYAVGMIVTTAVAVVIAVVINIAYTQHVQSESSRKQAELRHEADRRWCALLQIQAAPTPAPSTPRGVATQRESKQLLEQLGCEAR